MDTGYDFIQPEFLNILLFQQKSLVIFPYVDIKHLHSLEIFAVGYNIIDLDTTALHNIKEILELESFNAYSQNPSFFFITNVSRKQLGEIMGLDNVHCIINCNEDTKLNVNGDQFIFYNKKNNTFLNYTSGDLAFEKWLINSSKNISILQDKILKIKTMATNIFTELNDSGNPQSIAKILSEFEPQFWDKIIQFTRLFYGIEVPDIPLRPIISENVNSSLTSSFSDEYDVIISTNKKISKEFTQLIHEYRSKKVNPANLELEQLYFPRDLYDYLRTHHWKEGIDEHFLKEWLSMNISKCPLNEEDLLDFQKIFNAIGASPQLLSDFSLNIPIATESKLKNNEIKSSKTMSAQSKPGSDGNPSIEDFSRFRTWILKNIEKIEEFIRKNNSVETISYLSKEFTDLKYFLTPFLKDQKRILVSTEKENRALPRDIKEKLTIHLKKIYFEKFLSLNQQFDTYLFIISFIGYLEELNSILFGIDKAKKIPQKIKEFQFPNDLAEDILLINKWRRRLAHPKLSRSFEITPRLENKSRIIYMKFIIYFYTNQIKALAKGEGWDLLKYGAQITDFLVANYFSPFNFQEIENIINL